MMQEFAQRNRQLLTAYAWGARVIGWMLVVIGAVAGVLFLMDLIKHGGHYIEPTYEAQYAAFKRSWFELLVPGLVALGVSQFIRYLYEQDSKPGWLLRYGDKILYVYAAFLVWWFFGILVAEKSGNPAFTRPTHVWLIYSVLPLALLTAGKVLILVGIGQILRRVMPMAEESKTLV